MSTVLVVDDEIAIVKAASAILTQAGFGTLAALDGQEAVQMARLSKPDVIVTGIVMPALDGFSAAEEILKRHPTCRFLFVTGAAREPGISDRV